MEKLYKYIGIFVVSLLVVTLLIRLFDLNTQVIEGLTVKEVKKQKEQEDKELEKQQGTPLEKSLLKISKKNEEMDSFVKKFMDDKEVTEDILLELDEMCDKAILFYTISIAGDGNLDILEKKDMDKTYFEQTERMMSLKKAISQSMKYLTNNSGGSSKSGNTGGMFS